MTNHQTTIGEIAEIFDGPHATPKKIDAGPYFLSISSLINGRLELPKSAYLSEEDFIKWTKRVTPQEEDLLFSYETRLGQAALMPSGIKACLGRRMGLLRPVRSKVLPQYLLYAYLSPNFQQVILRNTVTGATVDRIALSEMAGFPIRIPPLNEQKIVADLLQAIDSKIELNNKINAELEAMAKLIYDYWFVQFDFPDANGKPYKSSGGKMVYNEELKREIPEGWEVKELDEVATCFMGQSPKGDTYNNDGVGTPLLNGPADYKNGALFGRTYTTAPSRLCEKNDLVLCIRATIGNLVYSEGQFCLGRGVAAVRPKNSTYSELIYFLILQEIRRFKMQATGSIIKGITKDDLAKSKCLIPSKNIGLSFHSSINPIFDKLRKNKEETLSLIELRDWLLPMLMNGQVTIKET
jgi:type I restriction enzyme S subunit